MRFLKWSAIGLAISILISVVTFILLKNDTAAHGDSEGVGGLGYLVFNFFAWVFTIIICMVIGAREEYKVNIEQGKKPITIPSRWIYFLIVLGLVLLFLWVRYNLYA